MEHEEEARSQTPMMHDPLGATMPFKEESEFYKAIRELYFDNDKESRLDFITQLSPADVINFSRAQVLDTWTDGRVPIISQFITNIKRQRVSEGRAGRKEFFETFRPMGFGQMQHEQGGFFGNLFQRKQ